MTRSPAARLVAFFVPLLVGGCLFAGEPTPTPTPRPACPTGPPPSQHSARDLLADASAVVVSTNKGSFTIELDASSAPIATANFVALARCGFYDGLTFHRVVAGFVAQAGDPGTRGNTGDFAELGQGDPGYRFEVEFPPESTRYGRYAVAMANGVQIDQATFEILGNTESNGSQFFIALADLPLPPYYSVLGRVTEGTDVVDAIGAVPVNGRQGLPLDPVIIESITVEAAAVGSEAPSPG